MPTAKCGENHRSRNEVRCACVIFMHYNKYYEYLHFKVYLVDMKIIMQIKILIFRCNFTQQALMKTKKIHSQVQKAACTEEK